MFKKVKFGPYMVKDGVIAKTRPWKKFKVSRLPTKLARDYPDNICMLVLAYDEISEENAMRTLLAMGKTEGISYHPAEIYGSTIAKTHDCCAACG